MPATQRTARSSRFQMRHHAPPGLRTRATSRAAGSWVVPVQCQACGCQRRGRAGRTRWVSAATGRGGGKGGGRTCAMTTCAGGRQRRQHFSLAVSTDPRQRALARARERRTKSASPSPTGTFSNVPSTQTTSAPPPPSPSPLSAASSSFRIARSNPSRMPSLGSTAVTLLTGLPSPRARSAAARRNPRVKRPVPEPSSTTCAPVGVVAPGEGEGEGGRRRSRIWE